MKIFCHKEEIKIDCDDINTKFSCEQPVQTFCKWRSLPKIVSTANNSWLKNSKQILPRIFFSKNWWKFNFSFKCFTHFKTHVHDQSIDSWVINPVYFLLTHRLHFCLQLENKKDRETEVMIQKWLLHSFLGMRKCVKRLQCQSVISNWRWKLCNIWTESQKKMLEKFTELEVITEFFVKLR